MEIVVDRIKEFVMEFFVFVLNAGAIIIALLCGVWFISSTIDTIERIEKKRRAGKMMEAASKHRRRFVVSIDRDITAVCTSAAFTKGLCDHNRRVKSGEIKEWEKVVVYAQPTFTFAGSEQTRRPIHTGVRENLQPIIGPIMLALTGVDPNMVDKRDYGKAISIIFERDSRLFVPYSGNLSDGEKQFALYGNTTIEQAIADINQASGL